MYDRLLVPTDGSEIATKAGELAVSMADTFDAELHIISISQEADTDRATAAVEAVAELAAAADLEPQTEVIQSRADVHEEIIGFAEDHDVDAIVMGTHGRTGLSRFLLGSVAMQTLRNSPIPVVTVHEETDLEFAIDDILVPTDGSPSSEAAAEHAIELAKATGATIHALHVGENGGSPAQAVADMATEQGVENVVTVVRSGRPHLEIVGYISEEDCDVVVMGTHGRTGIRRYIIGSVAERAVRFSTVPVVAVRPQLHTVTVEYLDYAVLEEQGWSIDDDDLFEKAAAANLDAEAHGTLEMDRGEYVLDAAETAGHSWPYHCRAGGCVNCAAVLVEGEMEMERCRSLSEEEVDEEHLRLTCVATPASDTVKMVYNAKEMDIFESRVM